MKKIPLLVGLFLLPSLAFAQDSNNYQCRMSDMLRRVEILREPGVSVPCEVHYYKDTEAPGEHQVLWQATNEDGYCEAKTTEFIAKLEEMGWACDSTMSTDESSETDDTDALAPADDIELDEPPR